MDICDLILPKQYKAYFHEDNTALIRVIRTGRNPTMRHLLRTHRVNIASLHEEFYKHEQCIFVYENSGTMAADIYTKSFTSPVKWTSARQAINILSSGDLGDRSLVVVRD